MDHEKLLNNFAERLPVKCILCDGHGQYTDWWSASSTTSVGQAASTSGTTGRVVKCRECDGKGIVMKWFARKNAGSVSA